MENCKLGDASFDEYDLFSPPSLKEEIFFDDTMPPIYDDYNDEGDTFSPPTIDDKISYDYDMPTIYDDYNDGYDSFCNIPILYLDVLHLDHVHFIMASFEKSCICLFASKTPTE